MSARRSASVVHATVSPLLDALRLPIRWLARQEAVVLLTAFVVVLALFGFVELVGEIREGEMHEFDAWLLRLVRRADNPALLIGPRWLAEAVTDVTALGGTSILVIVVLCAIGYLALQQRYSAALFVFVASAGGGVLSTGLKHVFARDRPDVVPHLVTVEGLSFPSGHSMAAAVIYLTLGALLARFAAPRRIRVYVISTSLVLAFLIGITRVCLGVHYPTDVLAGWSAGLAWALLCWLGARYLQYRGTVGAPGAHKSK
ncbi:MAG TPA: phosphatase PAP2 family protein [Methylomirabilota bacterium]|jgi:undecaprenyl-diphosphatase|nr:phosphatase PAP2 family protein [Methylomirabilota bacterium]